MMILPEPGCLVLARGGSVEVLEIRNEIKLDAKALK
jgi:hypothetical protein